MIDLYSITHFKIIPKTFDGLDSYFSVLAIDGSDETVDVVLSIRLKSLKNLVRIGFQEKYLISVTEYYGFEVTIVTIKQSDEMFQPLINMLLIEGALE